MNRMPCASKPPLLPLQVMHAARFELPRVPEADIRAVQVGRTGAVCMTLARAHSSPARHPCPAVQSAELAFCLRQACGIPHSWPPYRDCLALGRPVGSPTLGPPTELALPSAGLWDPPLLAPLHTRAVHLTHTRPIPL